MKRENLFILVNANDDGEIFYRGIYTNLNEAIGEAMQDAADLSESYKEAGDEFRVGLPEWLSSGAGYLITVTYKSAGSMKTHRDFWHILTGDLDEAYMKLSAGMAVMEVMKQEADKKRREEAEHGDH